MISGAIIGWLFWAIVSVLSIGYFRIILKDKRELDYVLTGAAMIAWTVLGGIAGLIVL